MVFVAIYYNTDEVQNSEVLGVYNNKEEAVKKLIKEAGYEEKENVFLQFKRITNDFVSMKECYDYVFNNNKLEDYDLYRIEEIKDCIY